MTEEIEIMPSVPARAKRREVAPVPSAAPAVVEPGDAMVAMIERVVLDPTASLDKLERMLAMKERLDAQTSRRAFDLALAAAKAAIPTIRKNRTVAYEGRGGGQKTSYQHEDLAEIARTVDPILGAHGLSYRYRTKQEGPTVSVTCIVSHRDGHSEETTLSSGPDTSGSKNPMQAVGSAITYLQRYTLKAALGLAAGEDDDGKVTEAAAPSGTITEAQFEELHSLIDETNADLGKFLAHFGIEGLDAMPAGKFATAKQMLNQKKRPAR